jgi:hypothetical protein
MKPNSEPCVGSWYAGERHTGAFRVIARDESSGVIHLQAADGRRVRMTFKTWACRPLNSAHGALELRGSSEHFEWTEPVVG